VQVTHDDGSVAIYCHMRLNSFTVSNGQRVSCGQKLGQSASSGSSTGPHLHLGWRRSSGASSQDAFRGSCTSSPGCWNQQNGYRDPVGTDCEVSCQPSDEVCDGQDNNCNGQVDEGVKNACGGCGPVPAEVCDGKDNDCDGQIDEDDLCEIAWLNAQAGMYAPARTTDINGDGRADVCGRGGVGLWCHEANGSGFALEPRSQVVPMESAAEWKEARHYATLRMGDIDGDGLADVCGRGAQGVRCWASDGARGWVEFMGPALSDDLGWGHPRYYSTIRLADINGDGKDDLCARDVQGLICWPSVGRGFGEAVRGPAWSDASGFGQAARFYGTLRFGDFNGDGKDDACIRHSEGYVCAASNGEGFDEPILVAPWGDAQGWGAMRYWATITLADINGDGKDDVCARDSQALRCVISRGTSFGDALVVAALSDEQGWDDMSNWSTLRVADFNGDGRDDLCLRSNAGVRCWAWNGGMIIPSSGPAWSDMNGWADAQVYSTIRFGDINGDGKDDVCGRAHAGWVCHSSTGTGFLADAEPLLDEFKSDTGWSAEQHWATLQLGGPRCSPEVCDGKDNDCDGVVDDDPSEAGMPCDSGYDNPCIMGVTACVGAAMRCEAILSTRPECAGLDMSGLDLGSVDLGGGGGQDMAEAPDQGPRRPNVEATGEIGCACEVAPHQPATAGLLWFVAMGMLGAVRRRAARQGA
jgi:MYXO-CTERM domain-containing protein